MSTVYRFRPSLHQPTPYAGPLPGSGRDLETTPLDVSEENTLAWLKDLLKASQRQLRRHGLAFDRDLLEAWRLFDQGERDVRNGTLTQNPHPQPARTAYEGNWYECIDCKARDGAGIRLEWKSGPGIMLGVSKDYISPMYNPRKQKDDLVNKTLVVFVGWLCPRCERKRLSEKLQSQAALRKSDTEQIEAILGEVQEPVSA